MSTIVTLDLGYGRKIVAQNELGPAQYLTGGFNVDIDGVNRVLDILKISNDGGFKVEPADCTIGPLGVTGEALRNRIRIVVRCYDYTYAGACGPAVELTNLSAALAAVTFEITILGI